MIEFIDENKECVLLMSGQHELQLQEVHLTPWAWNQHLSAGALGTCAHAYCFQRLLLIEIWWDVKLFLSNKYSNTSCSAYGLNLTRRGFPGFFSGISRFPLAKILFHRFSHSHIIHSHSFNLIRLCAGISDLVNQHPSLALIISNRFYISSLVWR